MNDLQRRVAATEKSKERYEGKLFDWSKRATCIHMIAYHARNMGHDLPLVPRFRSAFGAVKALKAEGVDTLPELMDKYFMRISPAQMLTGDIAAFPGDDSFDALMIYGQLRACLGWHEDAPDCQIARLTDEGYRLCTGAWRL